MMNPTEAMIELFAEKDSKEEITIAEAFEVYCNSLEEDE